MWSQVQWRLLAHSLTPFGHESVAGVESVTERDFGIYYGPDVQKPRDIITGLSTLFVQIPATDKT